MCQSLFSLECMSGRGHSRGRAAFAASALTLPCRAGRLAVNHCGTAATLRASPGAAAWPPLGRRASPWNQIPACPRMASQGRAGPSGRASWPRPGGAWWGLAGPRPRGAPSCRVALTARRRGRRERREPRGTASADADPEEGGEGGSVVRGETPSATSPRPPPQPPGRK